MANENGIVKGVLESLAYALDHDPDGAPDNGTWVTIPVLRVMQAQAVMPREQGQTQTTIAGLEASAAKLTPFAIPVAIRDIDTFLQALKNAEGDGVPVWFRYKPEGRNARIVGRRVGCLVRVDDDVIGPFGDFTYSIIYGTASGADPGSTFEVLTGTASGS